MSRPGDELDEELRWAAAGRETRRQKGERAFLMHIEALELSIDYDAQEREELAAAADLRGRLDEELAEPSPLQEVT